MYNDITHIDVDLANLELGAINPYTDMCPFFWLCLHEFWIYILADLGMPRFRPGLVLLIESTDFEGEQPDFVSIEFQEPPFRIIPSGLQLGIVTQYAQLNEDGSPNADN